MEKPTKILLIRYCYWLGAIIDLFVGIIMIFPEIFAIIYNIRDYSITVEVRVAMGMGVPLMLGWTGLLIWADKKPIERKDVLLLTSFVVCGEMITEFYAIFSNFITIEFMIPTLLWQICLITIFLYSYNIANNL